MAYYSRYALNYVDTDIGVRLDLGSFGVTLDLTNVAGIRGNRFSYDNPFSVEDRLQITPFRPRTFAWVSISGYDPNVSEKRPIAFAVKPNRMARGNNDLTVTISMTP